MVILTFVIVSTKPLPKVVVPFVSISSGIVSLSFIIIVKPLPKVMVLLSFLKMPYTRYVNNLCVSVKYFVHSMEFF